MVYIKSNKDQNWLLPLSIKEIIPKDHICFLVEDFIESLDYSNFDMQYFVMMYLAEKTQPDFRTIARFRKDNSQFVKDAFKKTVELADKNKLVDLSFISIDGSMLKANASKKKYFDKKNLDKIDKAIDKMVEEDIVLDELEDQVFGDREEGLTGMDERDLRRIVRDYRKSEDKKKVKKEY